MLINHINTLLIILIIIVIYIVYLTINSSNSINNKDNFIVTVNNVEYSDNCPDYITEIDGKYFIVDNNNPANPEIYNSLEEAHNKLKSIGCPKFKPVSLVTNKDNNSSNDPTVQYERKCNKTISLNEFLVDAYNYSINEDSKTIDNLNYVKFDKKGNKIIETDFNLHPIAEKIPAFLKKYDNSLYAFLNDTSSNISNDPDAEEIRNILNNYIKNANPTDLVNYNQQICMMNEYVNTASTLENTGSLNDNYYSFNNTSKIFEDEERDFKVTSTGEEILYKGEILKPGERIIKKEYKNPNRIYSSDIDDIGDIQEYPLMSNRNINRPITNLMMDKMFGV